MLVGFVLAVDVPFVEAVTAMGDIALTLTSDGVLLTVSLFPGLFPPFLLLFGVLRLDISLQSS